MKHPQDFLDSITDQADCNKLALMQDYIAAVPDDVADAAAQLLDAQHALEAANATIAERDAEIATLKINAAPQEPQP